MSALFRKEIMTMNFKWSEEEVLLLKDKYSCSTNDELIALFPNKTFLAIYKKAYSLNLKKDEEIKFLNRIKNDNRIENLCMMTNSAHTIYHHTGQKRSEETRKRISESKRKKYE